MESEEKKTPVTPPEDAPADVKPPAPEGDPEIAAPEPEDLPPSDPDWDSRVLCSDESCIGVIGPDGRCRECGKPAGPGFVPPAGDGETTGEAPADASPAQDPEAREEAPDGDGRGLDEELVIDDEEWRQRTLCSDESCIGVIGPDGRCRECGKPYRPDASS